MPEIV